jgi:hypothetical protein
MNASEQYSKEEMERILSRALEHRRERGETVSHEHLLEVAKELGLSEREIEQAVEEELSVGTLEQAKQEWLARSRQKWRSHLFSYLGVNAVVLGADLWLNGRITWSFGTVFGWGIGLFFDTIFTAFPSEEQLEQNAQKLLQKREKKRQNKLLNKKQ